MIAREHIERFLQRVVPELVSPKEADEIHRRAKEASIEHGETGGGRFERTRIGFVLGRTDLEVKFLKLWEDGDLFH